MTGSPISLARSRSRKRARLGSATALLAAALVTAPFRADGAPSHEETPTCFGEPATIVGDLNSGQRINGTPKADVIVAHSIARYVHAGKGADRVCGGGRTSEQGLYGGPGKDRLTTGAGSTLLGGPGNDVLREVPRCSRCGGILLGGEGADLLIGDYILTGGEGDDVLRWKRLPVGGDKLDRVTVPARFFILQGRITGDKGDDKIFGGDRGDDIRGGAGEDQLSGNAGNDSIHGADDDDLLRGGTGNDELDGGLDNDECRGEAGTDSAVNCEALSEVP
jgi:Ca2+-binding RTX toxin-like protein